MQVRLLLERGATVNLIDDRGWTGMLMACRYGHALTIVQMLSAHGADRSGWTAAFCDTFFLDSSWRRIRY